MIEPRKSRQGFTLIEIVISIGLLGIVLGSAAMVSRTGGAAHRTATAVQALEQNLHRALERAADEIAATGVDHFTGTDLVVTHVEKFWCPSFTSTDLTGKKPFRFAEDQRKSEE